MGGTQAKMTLPQKMESNVNSHGPLMLNSMGLTDEDMIELAGDLASPDFSHVTQLTLGGTYARRRSLSLFINTGASSLCCRTCTSTALILAAKCAGNAFTSRGARALVEVLPQTSLEHVDLRCTYFYHARTASYGVL